jgi:hypothetical protein
VDPGQCGERVLGEPGALVRGEIEEPTFAVVPGEPVRRHAAFDVGHHEERRAEVGPVILLPYDRGHRHARACRERFHHGALKPQVPLVVEVATAHRSP